MTDFEKTKELFDSLGIVYKILDFKTDDWRKIDGMTGLMIEAGEYDDLPPVCGYYGFYTLFYFDEKTGKFHKVGLWE
jgi:hypothetical protein